MREGERQIAPSLDGIRRDHLERYYWAAKELPPKSTVIDMACGVGYGSFILASAGHSVLSIDRDAEALAYAREHYSHPNIEHRLLDARDAAQFPKENRDAAICFETIEHIENPLSLLSWFCESAPLLLASVPNQRMFPWQGQRYHFRHYTQRDFAALVNKAGYAVGEWFGQVGSASEVAINIQGRTLIVVAKRQKESVALPKSTKRKPVDLPFLPPPDGPKSVAILGLGPSLESFSRITKRYGSTKKLCDEVWGINAVGDVYKCDRIFHMDRIAVQELRATAEPSGNIAAMLPWLKKHAGPIYTSIPDPAYPGMVAYPLADVLNSCSNQRYFNSTAAYAVAFAIHLGVKKIMCFGFDFSYKDSHKAEKGRGCVEFWLGFARARGIDIAMPFETSLMDACESPEQRFYGYDGVKLEISGEDGRETIKFTETELPTADEIEDRYNHTKPTVPEHLR